MSERKSATILKAEHDEYRKYCGKVYVHKTNGEKYHLLFSAFNAKTNEIEAVFGLVAMPWMKFTQPFDAWLEEVEESH